MEQYLEFAYPISEAYRVKLQTFADNILAKGITQNSPPVIGFTGMNQLTFSVTASRQRAYNRRYGT